MTQERNERYSLNRILALRNKLFELVMESFLDQTPVGEDFYRLVALFRRVLPSSVVLTSLEDSLQHLAGQLLTRDLIRETCWRMAGNIPQLAREIAVPPWHTQPIPEWVPIQIERSRRQKNNAGLIGSQFYGRIMAGTSCPLLVTHFWTIRYCRYLARDFGFSRNASPMATTLPKYLFTASEQFVLLRFLARISPKLSNRRDGPIFDAVAMPSDCLKWNKEQLKYRFRVDDGYACPMRYPDDFACHLCPHGYRTTCRASTHPFEYVVRLCSSCGKEAYFDDLLSTQLCIVCTNELVFKGVSDG